MSPFKTSSIAIMAYTLFFASYVTANEPLKVYILVGQSNM